MKLPVGRKQTAGLVMLLGLAGACDRGALERALAPESVQPDVVELYLPEGAEQEVDEAVTAALAANDQDVLRIKLPALEGSLGSPLDFASQPASLELPVGEVAFLFEPGRVDTSVVLGEIEAELPVDVYSDGELLRTCFLHVVVPPRQLEGELAWGRDADNLPVVSVEDPPLLEGEPVSLSLPYDCPQQPGSELETVWEQAFLEAQAVGADQLIAAVADTLGGTAGLDAGAGLSLQAPGAEGVLHVDLGPRPGAVNAGAGDVRVGLTGGVESTRAACVPSTTPVVPPDAMPPAVFDQQVPRTGDSYTMGISISRSLLRQGLEAAHRAGWFCRRPSAGELPGVSLAGALPSLESIGTPQGVRLALWPATVPVLRMDEPLLDAGEKLPRLEIDFARLDVDVYTDLGGADLRLLGLSASVRLELIPELDGELLGVRLGRVEIGDMAITFAELPTESETVLRSVAATLLEQAAAALIGDLDPVRLERPGAAGGELLGARVTDDRVLLYFRP